jgi:hypothetical protein
MKQIALRLPDDLHADLVELAKRDQRSLHAQVLWILRQALKAERPATLKERL